MTRRGSIGRAGVALVAAYALALQALLASFGVGGAVVGHQLATLAGAICTSSPDAPVTPTEHDRAACCILCSAPAPASTGPIEASAEMTDVSSSRLIAPAGGPHLGMIAWLPGGARAPPARV